MRRRVVSRILVFLSITIIGLAYQNCSPINIKRAEQIASTTPLTTPVPDSPPTLDSIPVPDSAPAPATTFNPKSWMKIDSNTTFDMQNAGRVYYINGKIIGLFMSMSAYFFVYDVARKDFVSAPPVPAPIYPGTNDRAPSFALGDSLFVILGTTLWKYSTVTNNWVNKGIVPGNDHRNAFSFTANGNAYINGGFYNAGKTLKYFPTNNQWVQIGDHTFISASAEYGSYFELNNKAYVYGGSAITEYDPSTDTWNDVIKSVYYKPRQHAMFSMNNKGYLMTERELFNFDPAAKTWVKLKDYSPNYFCNLFGVGAGTSAYLFVGGNSNSCELWHLIP